MLAQRATPLPPQPLRVVVGKQLRRPAGAAGGLAVGAQQQRKDALDLKERPVGVPQKAQRDPTAPSSPDHRVEKIPPICVTLRRKTRQRCGGRIVVTVTAREPASEGEADTEGEAVPRQVTRPPIP